MTIDRRLFLKSTAVVGAGLALGIKPDAANAQTFGGIPFGAPAYGLPTVQLYTDQTTAQFRVLFNPLQPVTFEASAADGRKLPLSILSITESPHDENAAFAHLFVEGLSLNTDYKLEAFDDRTGVRVEERIFRALDIYKTAGKFAVASCMMDLLDGSQSAMWASMARARPEVVFMVGDTCYADVGGDGTMKGHWRRHIESRRNLDVFKWKRLIPVFATWDDHDFGGNNSNKSHAFNGQSIKVFEALFGWTPRGASLRGPGVARFVDLFGQRFFLMDDRSFRDVNNIEKGLQWGDTQEQWVLKTLTDNTRPAWLMNGSQFFGAYLQKESMEGNHPYQLQRLAGSLRYIEAPIIFASGDVHFSELMNIETGAIGYPTFEITSSSMHSTTNPFHHQLKHNKRRFASTWHHNYVVIESGVNFSTNQLDFRARSFGANLVTYFDHQGSVRR